MPPHSAREAWQERAHEPAEQTSPASHGAPQPPQFLLSLWTLTQPPPHSESPDGQVVAHEPPEQTSPGAQTLPQAPQCVGFEPVSTQAPPHSVWPAEHEVGFAASDAEQLRAG